MPVVPSMPVPSFSLQGKGSPTDLREAMQDLMSMKDMGPSSGRLVAKLVGLASDSVEVSVIDETPLRLLQVDGTHHKFKLHPQGMELDLNTGLLYITAVEIIENKDEAWLPNGRGTAHLFECDIEGNTIRSIKLESDHEEEYHPSGMVLMDGIMFIALSQYIPYSSATIIRFDVKDWTYEKLFRIQDHVGLVVPFPSNDELLLGNWGSRYYHRTDLKGKIKAKYETPCSDDMEHQDAQLINGLSSAFAPLTERNIRMDVPDEAMVLATGVTADSDHFGLDLICLRDWSIRASLRWPSAQHLTKGGWAPFANPTYLWVDSYQRVLALATPDDCHAQIGKDAKLLLYTLTPHN